MPFYLSAAHLQSLCAKPAAKIMDNQDDRTQREYRLFSRFCEAASIPLYPITPALIKLCQVAKEDGEALPRSLLSRTLEKLVGVGKHLFNNKAEYIKLCELSDEIVGVEDDDSSTGISDTADDDEADALSTDTETDDDDNPSDRVCTSILVLSPSVTGILTPIFVPCSVMSSDSSSGDEASRKGVARANSPGRQHLGNVLASSASSSSSFLTHFSRMWSRQ